MTASWPLARPPLTFRMVGASGATMTVGVARGEGVAEGVTDAGRRRALEARWRKMRALPRGSRYAKQQCELIEKALEILERGKRNGTRSVEEEDELAGLLKAVKL